MIWIARLLFAVLFLTFLDLLHALVGLLLSSFSYRKHPRLHHVGLYFLSGSFFTQRRVLPRRCEMVCGVDPCRCWLCPVKKAYAKNTRQDLDA